MAAKWLYENFDSMWRLFFESIETAPDAVSAVDAFLSRIEPLANRQFPIDNILRATLQADAAALADLVTRGLKTIAPQITGSDAVGHLGLEVLISGHAEEGLVRKSVGLFYENLTGVLTPGEELLYEHLGGDALTPLEPLPTDSYAKLQSAMRRWYNQPVFPVADALLAPIVFDLLVFGSFARVLEQVARSLPKGFHYATVQDGEWLFRLGTLHNGVAKRTFCLLQDS